MKRFRKWQAVIAVLAAFAVFASITTVFASGEASPTPEAISRGVALALSTTILGLCIAIPAIVGNSYLNRKIDKLCAQINICVERLIDIRRESGK